MSLSTMLALVAGIFVRQREDPRDIEIEVLKAEVKDLRRDRDEWRSVGQMYRDSALQSVQHQNPSPRSIQQTFAIQQAHQAIAQQQVGLMQQIMAQNLQNAQQMTAQNLVGNQLAQCLDPNVWVNCVPARQDILTNRTPRL